MKLNILTANGLLKLRSAIALNPRLILQPLRQLAEAYPEIEFFESNYDFDETVTLEVAGAGESPSSRDIANCVKIKLALPGLTRADGFDERLWVSLALGQFHSYTLGRWGSGLNLRSSTKDLAKFYVNHVLVLGARDRWRNQSISRLWWQAEYATTFAPANTQAALELIVGNTEFASQMLGKPSVGTSLPLAQAILNLSVTKFVTLGEKYDRNGFRSFMKKVDLLAGRRLLSGLDPRSLARELEPLFNESIK